jgi:SAM-dependent methyltransferase
MSREELIQEINVLGPWVHGYFDLGNDIIIEDQDILQKKRLFCVREYLFDILRSHFGRNQLNDKTLGDIGCNTGYFLFELFKEFQFKRAEGLEPRESNLSKARFVSDYFNIPKARVVFRKFDLLYPNGKMPSYDVVLMLGVVHHLDDHLFALANVRRMTKEICIIDSMVLPEEVNTPEICKSMELTDDAYKKYDFGFGVMGYKYESSFLDGSAAHTGIVGVPTEKALVMMLNHVGFKNVRIYRDNQQLKNEVYNIDSYHRGMNSVIIVAEGGKEDAKDSYREITTLHGKVEQEDFDTPIPMDIIAPLFDAIAFSASEDTLPELSSLIYLSECCWMEKRGVYASKKLFNKLGKKPYYHIIKTFRHAPRHKIVYEYAKTCFHAGHYDMAESVSNELITICNLDWRTVFRTYYLLARIFLKHNDRVKAKYFNDLSLRAYAYYAPAIMLKKQF